MWMKLRSGTSWGGGMDDRFPVESFAAALASLGLRVRVLLRDGRQLPWSPWLTMPSPSYVETSGAGPYPLREVTAFQIDAIERRQRGRLLAPLEVDRSQELRAKLDELGVRYSEDEPGLLGVAVR